MNQSILLGTDGARFVFYVPLVIKEYEGGDLDEYELRAIQGIKDGLFFGFNVGGDGRFRIKLADEELSDIEKAYATSPIKRLGINVKSGRFWGSGYTFDTDETTIEGKSFEIPNGEYDISMYEICWHFSMDEERLKADEDVPDFVILITERKSSFEISDCELKLETIYIPEIPIPELCQNPFVFESDLRNLKEEYLK